VTSGQTSDGSSSTAAPSASASSGRPGIAKATATTSLEQAVLTRRHHGDDDGGADSCSDLLQRQLAQREGDHERDAGAQRQERDVGRCAVGADLREAVDQRAEAAGCEHDAHPVDQPGDRLTDVGEPARAFLSL